MEPMIRLDQTYRFGLPARKPAAPSVRVTRGFNRLRFGLPAPPATV